MGWNETFPDGSVSVKSNEIIGQDNTTYIKTTSNVDHYWDVSGTNDGHHQFVQSPMQGTAAVPTNPALAAGMDGVVYYKAKTAVEAPANQDVQPFFIDNKAVAVPGVIQVMQLLGIRVMGVFTAVGGVITMQYSHNLTSVSKPAGSTGVFQANFPALPSNNYLFYGGAVTNSSATGNSTKVFVTSDNTLTNVKSTIFLKFRTIASATNSLTDPLQCWFVIFGG